MDRWLGARALPRRRVRRVRAGMSLVEVMVVVTILLALMVVISLGVSQGFADSTIETEAIEQARQDEAQMRLLLRQGGAQPGQPTVTAAVVRQEVRGQVKAEAVPERLWVHSRLALDARARYTVVNPDPSSSVVTVSVPLPEAPRTLRVTLQRAGEEPFVPADAKLDGGQLSWSGTLAAGQPLTVEVAWLTVARDRLSLPTIAGGVPVDIDVALSLPDGFPAEIPDGAPAPTEVEGRTLRWQIDDAVHPTAVAVALPADDTVLGRTAAVCRLAVLGLLVFFGGFWYLHEGERPGHLDDFHLGGLLLLALNYGVFFAIHAVLSLQAVPWAAPVAGAVAVPLLVLHVARLTSPRFAVTRALPLVVGTFGTVLAVVASDAWRPLVVLGAGVVGLAVVTLTWRSWHTTRQRWAAQQARHHLRADRAAAIDGRRSGLRHVMETHAAQVEAARRSLGDLPAGLGAERAAVVRAAARLERAIDRARSLSAVPLDTDGGADEVHEGRCAAWGAESERVRSAIEALGAGLGTATAALEQAARGAGDELADALSRLDRAIGSLGLAEAEGKGVEQRVPQRIRDASGLDEALAQAVDLREAARALSDRVSGPDGGGADDLRAIAATARQLAQTADQRSRALCALAARVGEVRDTGPAAIHCPACGAAHVAQSRYCSGCGAGRPVELTCGACAQVNRLPRHLLRTDWGRQAVHCGGCGAALAVVGSAAEGETRDAVCA